jgi:Flp pilus assembly protein TadG
MMKPESLLTFAIIFPFLAPALSAAAVVAVDFSRDILSSHRLDHQW